MENPFRRRGACELERPLPKKPFIVNATIRTFSASAFLNNSHEIVEAALCRGWDPSALAESAFKSLLLSLPRRERAGRESVRQQTD